MRLYLRPDLKLRGIPWSNTWLLKLERTGRFPPRRYLGPHTPAWDADAVDRLIEERFAAGSEAA